MAGVNVVSLMPIPRRGCAPVNRVNRVQGNQCARETRPAAERTHYPFYLSAALKLAHPVRASHPRQYGKLAQFSNRCCFPSPYFLSIHFPMYMYRLRSRVEIRDSLKIVAPSWKKTLSNNSTIFSKSRRKTISGSLFSLEGYPSAAIEGDVRLLFPTGFSSTI